MDSIKLETDSVVEARRVSGHEGLIRQAAKQFMTSEKSGAVVIILDCREPAGKDLIQDLCRQPAFLHEGLHEKCDNPYCTAENLRLLAVGRQDLIAFIKKTQLGQFK